VPGPLSVLVRDPRSSRQVWSRYEGYPGDGRYLEFHRTRSGGLKLWRVTDRDGDLGAKEPYDPAAAEALAGEHAAHFAGLLSAIAAEAGGSRGGVIAAPFDTELFGHWWFEGPRFLDALFRRLASAGGPVRPVTAGRHLAATPPRAAVRLDAGSWGNDGDWSMWLGTRTAWTWERLWPLEEAFWDAAPAALASTDARPVLAQAARELLLAQASDWQFILTTGAAADYAELRFREHCEGAESLVGAENVVWNLDPSMGSEDFSFMLQEKPGAYLRLGQGGMESGCFLHNTKYDFNDAVIPTGAALLASLAEKALPL
jgi:1,4-alpha-glucan branching enzyme